MQNITITKVAPPKGSNQTRWNVDLEGIPFGAMWTFRNTKTEKHGFHAKPLNGMHKIFTTYQDAETYMRGEM